MGFKMKKDLWGLYNSAESATRQGNSSATPITKKASPFKMNAALVSGAADVGMSGGFNNVAGAIEKPSLSEKQQVIYKEPAKVPPPPFDEGKAADLEEETDLQEETEAVEESDEFYDNFELEV